MVANRKNPHGKAGKCKFCKQELCNYEVEDNYHDVECDNSPNYVYVLAGLTNHEGSTNIGIATTHRDALKLLSSHCLKESESKFARSFDGYEILKRKLNTISGVYC